MCLVFLLHDRSLICKFSVEKVVAGYLNTSKPFFGVVVLVFVRLFQPVCATLALFRFVSASFTLTTMAVGNTSEGFASFLSLLSQARRFSQFELKVGELGFPVHFVCVSAALYHRGHAAAIFFP